MAVILRREQWPRPPSKASDVAAAMNIRTSMKIQTRLQFSFGAILLMVLCVGIAGALTMRKTSASLSAALKDSFQVTTATEQLAALAHEQL